MAKLPKGTLKYQPKTALPSSQVSVPVVVPTPLAALPPSPGVSGLTVKTLKERMMQFCDDNNYDPVRELLRIIDDSKGRIHEDFKAYKDSLTELCVQISTGRMTATTIITALNKLISELDPLVKRIPTPEMKEIIGIHKEIMSYVAPKQKAVEVSASVDHRITVVKRQF